MHSVVPGAALYFEAAHLSQNPVTNGPENPAGHSSRQADIDMLPSIKTVPEGHGRHNASLEPPSEAEYFPPMQSWQLVVASEEEYVPFAQSEHGASATASLNFPAIQAVQVKAFEPEKPGPQ